MASLAVGSLTSGIQGMFIERVYKGLLRSFEKAEKGLRILVPLHGMG